MASKTKSKSASPAIAPLVAIGGGFGRDLSNGLFPAFLVMILLGFFCIWRFGSAAGNPNPVRALFIAMNSATLSGFNESPGVGGLNDFGQWISFALIIGGSLFTMIVGGLAVIRIARLPFKDGQLILAAFLVQAAALLVGMLLLWESDRSLFQALYLAASAFGNCGLYVADVPGPTNLPVHAVILPLTILGSLGLPVLMELWCAVVLPRPGIIPRLRLQAGLSAHSKSVIATSASIYIVGLILILFLNQAGHGGLSLSGMKSQLPASSVLAIESRTGGLPVAGIADLTQPARWLIVVLMAIGANSAGTGSGLKTTTLIELIRGTRKLLRGESPSRSFAIAFVWLAVYMGLALGAILLLAYVSSADPADNVLFNAISALSNVGFTIAPVPDQKGIFFAYSAIILVGRMAPLMVLWWMAETTIDAELAIG